MRVPVQVLQQKGKPVREDDRPGFDHFGDTQNGALCQLAKQLSRLTVRATSAVGAFDATSAEAIVPCALSSAFEPGSAADPAGTPETSDAGAS